MLSVGVSASEGGILRHSATYDRQKFRSKTPHLVSVAIGAGITESSPAIATDGTLYFGSNDNYIYALTGGT